MKGPKFTQKQVETALEQCAGVLSAAAAKLHCAPTTVTNYVNRSKRLQKRLKEIIEENLDLAESKLLLAIRDGNMTAVIFYLKTKGKHRGYTERSDAGPAAAQPVDVSKLSDAQLQDILQGKPADAASPGGARAQA
jgi:hypothetical protein